MRVTSAVSVGAQCAPNLRAEPLDGYGVLKYGDEVLRRRWQDITCNHVIVGCRHTH